MIRDKRLSPPLQRPKQTDNTLTRSKTHVWSSKQLGAEIEKLTEVGSLKNKRQVMTVARLMVRTEDTMDRIKLLDVINNTKEQIFLRLFLDYHGLQLLWSWMADFNDKDEDETSIISLRVAILQVLSILPVPNKTVLVDSKVWDVVEKWSKLPEPEPKLFQQTVPTPVKKPSSSSTSPVVTTTTSVPITISNETKSEIQTKSDGPELMETDVKNEILSTDDIKNEGADTTSKEVKEEIKGENADQKTQLETQNSSEVPNASSFDDDPFQEDTAAVLIESVKSKFSIVHKSHSTEAKDAPQTDKASNESQVLQAPLPNIAALARRLLVLWKDLKEAYKIPRMIRQKRAEDEQAADALWNSQNSANNQANQNHVIPDATREIITNMMLSYGKKKPNFTTKNNESMFNGDYQIGTTDCQQPLGNNMGQQQPMAPKVDKMVHRAQFEMEQMKKQYQEEMVAMQAKIAELERQKGQAAGLPVGFNHPPPPIMSQSDQFNSTQFDGPYDHAIAPDNSFNRDSNLDYEFNYPPPQLGDPLPYDESINIEEVYHEDFRENLPPITVDNHSNILIDCCKTSSNDNHDSKHELRSDSDAVIHSDYGIECVPLRKKLKNGGDKTTSTISFSVKSNNDLRYHPFDETFPAPGIYYSCQPWYPEVPTAGVYYIPSAMDSNGIPNIQEDDNFYGFENLDARLPRVIIGEDVFFGQGDPQELPKGWKKSLDATSRRPFYYHKRKRKSQWSFPTPLAIETKDETMDEDTKAVVSDLASGIKSTLTTPNDHPASSATSTAESDSNATNSIVTASATPNVQPMLADSTTPGHMGSSNVSPLEPPGSPLGIFAMDVLKKLKAGIANGASDVFSNRNSIDSNESSSRCNEADQSRLSADERTTDYDSVSIKKRFKEEVSEYIKKQLNVYRKPDCRKGFKIESNEMFKELARKVSFLVWMIAVNTLINDPWPKQFTHEVFSKEIGKVKSDHHPLALNEEVKTKAKNYIKKYMDNLAKVSKQKKQRHHFDENQDDDSLHDADGSVEEDPLQDEEASHQSIGSWRKM